MRPRLVRGLTGAFVAIGALGICLQIGVLHSPSLPVQSTSVHDRERQIQPRDAPCFGAADTPLLQSSVSIIAATCNRTDSLLQVLPSWLAARGVAEIVLVDWSSSPPLASLPALRSDPRLRLVRAMSEVEWNLARAYNLAARVARGALLLKLDSDTWLDRAFVSEHRLPDGAFLAGDWRHAPDENAQHLNGVVLVRRDDYFAVNGYDERLRGYGWDDTDFYARLQEPPRALLRLGINYSFVAHNGASHADRGHTWAATEFLHRRAVSAVWQRWHLANILPGSWEQLERGGGSGGSCVVRCVRRPPYLDELLAGASDDVGLMAVEWRYAYSSAIGRIVHGSIPPRALQRVAEPADYRSLLAMYEGIVGRKERWLAVQVLGELSERLLAVCSALTMARRFGWKLLLIWSVDDSLRAPFSELLSIVEAEGARVIGHFDARLFPSEFWVEPPAPASASATASAMASAMASTSSPRGLLLRSAHPIRLAYPTADEEMVGVSRCLREDLTPSNAVAALVRPWSASVATASGLHFCSTASAGRTASGAPDAVTDHARPADLNGARWAAAAAALATSVSLANHNASADPAPHSTPTWEVECSEEGVVRAVRALQTRRPDAPVFLALEEPGRWLQLRAQMQSAGLSPSQSSAPPSPRLISLGAEREHAQCTTAASRRESPCAQIELAELLLLGSTSTLVRSVGCVASDVASYLVTPGTPLHTCCRHHGENPPLAFVSKLRPLAGSARLRTPVPNDRKVARHAEATVSSVTAAALAQTPDVAVQSEARVSVDAPIEAEAARRASNATTRGPRIMTRAAFQRSEVASKGVQIELVHSTAVDARLPEAMRTAKLVFVAPRTNLLRSLARKIQATLQMPTRPRLLDARGAAELPEGLTVAEAHRQYAVQVGTARVLQVSVSPSDLLAPS